jgi:hypothetical protein
VTAGSKHAVETPSQARRTQDSPEGENCRCRAASLAAISLQLRHRFSPHIALNLACSDPTSLRVDPARPGHRADSGNARSRHRSYVGVAPNSGWARPGVALALHPGDGVALAPTSSRPRHRFESESLRSRHRSDVTRAALGLPRVLGVAREEARLLPAPGGDAEKSGTTFVPVDPDTFDSTASDPSFGRIRRGGRSDDGVLQRDDGVI